jgi:hypothetical protein
MELLQQTPDGQMISSMPVHKGDRAATDMAKDMHCSCPPISNRCDCVTKHVMGGGNLRARARMVGGCKNSGCQRQPKNSGLLRQRLSL